MDTVADSFRALPVRHAWVLPGLHLATRTEGHRRQLRSFLGAGSPAEDFRTYRSQDAGEELVHAFELVTGELRQQLGERTGWLRRLGPLPFLYQASSEAISGTLHSAESQNPKTMYRLYVVADCVARVSLILLSVGLFSTAMHQASNWLPKEAQNLFNKIADISGATTGLCLIGMYVVGVSCIGQLVSEGRRQEDTHATVLRHVGRGLYKLIRNSPGWISDIVALMALRKLSTFGQVYSVWRGLYRGYEIYTLFAPPKENPLTPMRFHSSQEAEDYCTLRRLQGQLKDADQFEEAIEGLVELEQQATVSPAVSQRAARARDQAILKRLAEEPDSEMRRLLTAESLHWMRHVPPELYRFLRDEGGSAGKLAAAAELDEEQRSKVDLADAIVALLTPEVRDAISQQKRQILYNSVEERDYYYALADGQGSWWKSIQGAKTLSGVLSSPGQGFRDYLPWGFVDALSTEQYTVVYDQLQLERSSSASHA